MQEAFGKVSKFALGAGGQLSLFTGSYKRFGPMPSCVSVFAGRLGCSARITFMNADPIVHRPEGLYCPDGDFYIDPWQPVDRAVITHAHSDHARGGSAHYLAAAPAESVLRARLGDIDLQTLPYGKPHDHFGIRISFHPRATYLARRRCASNVRGMCGLRRATTTLPDRMRIRAKTTRRARRSSRSLPHVRHGIDVWSPDLSMAAASRRVLRDQRLVAR